MSLYKTQRCRHFDEAGNAIKPYCSQGNKCRFIHPNDHQWTKLKRRNDTPSPERREVARSKGKKPPLSPGSPPPRSSLIPQTDLFKRKENETSRERDHEDRSMRNGDRRRDSNSWAYTRERSSPRTWESRYPQKRANEDGDIYPNQRPRLSERSFHRSAPASGHNNTRPTAEPVKPNFPAVSERDSKSATKVSDTFRRLAKLCCEIVQDTCFLDRDEDKLKAFTGLSSELSRAVPDSAVVVTPALATVITGHTRTRERLESHVEELEALWKTLFSILEADICKVIDARLEQAVSLLDKEKENALRMISRSQRLGGTTTDKALSDRGAVSVNGGLTANASFEETRSHEGDLGTSLRNVLEDMKMQMNRQTRAIESLALENPQLRTAMERVPSQPLVPPDSASSSSPRKSSML